MIKITGGQGRIVLIFFNTIVVKIPKNAFGVLSSLDELIRPWKYKEFKFFLCPRIFFLGLIIMPYCSQFKAEHITPEFEKLVIENIGHPLFLDLKDENLGIYKGKIVRVDYGRGMSFTDVFISFSLKNKV